MTKQQNNNIRNIALGVGTLFILILIGRLLRGNGNSTYKGSNEISAQQLQEVKRLAEISEIDKIYENITVSGYASKTKEGINNAITYTESLTNRLLEVIESEENVHEKAASLNKNMTFYCDKIIKITLYKGSKKDKAILDNAQEVSEYGFNNTELYPIQVDTKMKEDSTICITNIHYFF